MCIVIDVNTLSSVFTAESQDHAEFSPIKAWIDKGWGFIVIGGTTYIKELEKADRYLRFIRQMKDAGQAVSIDDVAVDEREIRVRNMTSGQACDDQHIIALLGVSYCPLFCSKDSRSFEYIKDRRLYPKGMKRVKIYTESKNADLLVKTDWCSLKNVK